VTLSENTKNLMGFVAAGITTNISFEAEPIPAIRCP